MIVLAVLLQLRQASCFGWYVLERLEGSLASEKVVSKR